MPQRPLVQAAANDRLSLPSVAERTTRLVTPPSLQPRPDRHKDDNRRPRARSGRVQGRSTVKMGTRSWRCICFARAAGNRRDSNFPASRGKVPFRDDRLHDQLRLASTIALWRPKRIPGGAPACSSAADGADPAVSPQVPGPRMCS